MTHSSPIRASMSLRGGQSENPVDTKPNVLDNDVNPLSSMSVTTNDDNELLLPQPSSTHAPSPDHVTSPEVIRRPIHLRTNSGSSSNPLDKLSNKEPSEEVDNVEVDSTHTDSVSAAQGDAAETGPSGKRREANRLAAQRFRTRKKGYVEELEGKVAGLEREKEKLLRRIGDLIDAQTRRARMNVDDSIKLENGRRISESISSSSRSYSRKRSRSPSSAMSGYNSHGSSVDKAATLEAANRHLQEELRLVTDRNVKLSEALDQWRVWEMETRSTRDRDSGHRSTDQPYRPTLPPVETGYSRQHANPAPPFQPTLPAPIPTFHRQHSYHGEKSASHPSSHPSLSPHFRLPPLRLAPLSPQQKRPPE